MKEIVFEPIDSYALNGRGCVLTGPCPTDPETDNIREAIGRIVLIDGCAFRILGVETFAKLPPPRRGEPIGLLVGPRLTRIVNIHHEACDVLITRPSLYGNKYVIGRDGSRDEVIAQHRADVLADPEFQKRVKKDLTGKNIGCVCKEPDIEMSCHGDIYADICNGS